MKIYFLRKQMMTPVKFSLKKLAGIRYSLDIAESKSTSARRNSTLTNPELSKYNRKESISKTTT